MTVTDNLSLFKLIKISLDTIQELVERTAQIHTFPSLRTVLLNSAETVS